MCWLSLLALHSIKVEHNVRVPSHPGAGPSEWVRKEHVMLSIRAIKIIGIIEII